MQKIDIFGENRYEQPSIQRIGCRGIIMRESQILLVHELLNDFYMIPGGGHEPGETLEECCIRELREETGYVVKPNKKGAFLELNEYYGEYHFIDYYYSCEVVGSEATELTEAEVERKLVAEWVAWEEALEIFSRHQDYASSFEEKRGAYLREYTALQTLDNYIES
jgi:8-oxo-dGTP pyrophosphatase MutT (NUDIX family)